MDTLHILQCDFKCIWAYLNHGKTEARTVFIRTFMVNFIAEQAKKAQKGSTGIDLLFL